MGLSVARQLSAKGASIVIASRNVALLEQALVEIKAAAKNPSSQRFHFISADVSQPEYAQSLIAEAVAWNNNQALDIVWCIAGMSKPDLWIEAPLSSSRSQMDINFWGSAEMAHAILREWCAPDAPVVPEPKHLIFTSSVVAFFPIVGYGPYSPAKAALRSLADTLVQELQLYPQNVKVHVVYPSSIQSPGFDRENITKPDITKIIEDGDPVQIPDVVAAKSIKGLERGKSAVTIAFLGDIMKISALGSSPRDNWLVETILSLIVPIAMLFVLPDILGKIRKFGKKNGHPVNYRKKTSID
jgi:3-dehydrosphinganine reductase